MPDWQANLFFWVPLGIGVGVMVGSAIYRIIKRK